MSSNLNIAIENVSLGYGKNTLLEGADLKIASASITGVFGRNGSGKTTFLKSLSALIPVLKGSIRIGEQSIDSMSYKTKAQMISIVFANRPSVTNMRVVDFVSYGRFPYTNWLGLKSKHDLEKIEYVLNQCGIIGINEKSINELSDGEMQKVQIARALAQDTPILLLDEPVSHLDMANKADIFNLLKKINSKEGKTIIFTSHDLQFSLQLASDFIVMNKGRIETMSNESFVAAKKYQDIMNSEYFDFDPHSNALKYKVS